MTTKIRHAVTLAALIALAGCGIVSSTTTNGVTTVTLNTAEVASWAQAGENALTLIATLPGVAGSPTATTLTALSTTVANDAAQFAAQTAGQTSVVVDTTSPQAFVSTLLSDLKTVGTDIGGAAGSVVAGDVGQAQTYVAAFNTILSIFEAQMQAAPTASAASMTEAQALATLGVK